MDPWGGDLTGPALRTLQRLREEGDELETRQAWLEQLADQAQCPVCKGEIDTIEVGGITRLQCRLDSHHLEWP